jgi:predicted permease
MVFSLVDGVLIRDLPFRRTGELVNVWKTYPQWRGQEVVSEAWDKIGLTWTEYRTLRSETAVFQELGVHRARAMTLTGAGDPARLVAGEANPALFPLLGLRLALGRGFRPEEEGPGTARVAVLSHALWTSRFGSDREIIGRTVDLNGEPFEVIGVLAEDVPLPSPIFGMLKSAMDDGARALWVPLCFDGTDGSQDKEAIGRLASGVTLEQARAAVDALLRNGKSEERLGFRLTPPKEEIVGGSRSALRLLLAASGVLLLIACANTAALLMSEALGRRREVATRMALGAGRLRIVRQLLTESVILGLLASGLGLLLASAGIRTFLALAPPLPRLDQVGIHPVVLAFSILSGVLTGIVFGLAPALSLRGESLRSLQVAGGRGVVAGGGRFQRGFLGVELALTLVLLVSGGLLVRSLVNLRHVDPGFDETALATVRVHLSSSGADDAEQRRRLLVQVLEKIRSIPGVERAGGVDGLPFPGRVTGSSIKVDRGNPTDNPSLVSRNHFVTPGYLEAMGIPVVAGRTFRASDAAADSPPVMVINQTLALRYWRDASPVGSRILCDNTWFEVVGVVGDIVERHLAEDPKPMVYRAGPESSAEMDFVARGRGEASTLAAEMRRAIWSVDPDLPLSQVSTLPTLVRDSTASERYRTFLFIAFGILATLVTSVGVFGVTAHSVSTRRREMGIRLAMGAERGRLVRAVVTEALLPGWVGMCSGLLGALVVSRLMAAYLFGIEAWDVGTYLVVVALLSGLSTAAAAIPAARAGRLDPSQVLRED